MTRKHAAVQGRQAAAGRAYIIDQMPRASGGKYDEKAKFVGAGKFLCDCANLGIGTKRGPN